MRKPKKSIKNKMITLRCSESLIQALNNTNTKNRSQFIEQIVRQYLNTSNSNNTSVAPDLETLFMLKGFINEVYHVALHTKSDTIKRQELLQIYLQYQQSLPQEELL
jgi:hypothetical protein